MKRWMLLTAALLLLAVGMPLAQLITGGASGGGSGLNSVTTSNGIQGNGTGSSPVALITPVTIANGGTGQSTNPNFFSFPNWMCSAPNSAQHVSAGNQLYIVTVNIPQTITASHVGFAVQAGDAVGGNNYDWGLYNSAGTLVANLGATALATATFRYLPLAQGTVIFPPGQYFEGFTGMAATGSLFGCSGTYPVIQYDNNAFASPTSTAGALPTAITAPTFNPTVGPAISFTLMP